MYGVRGQLVAPSAQYDDCLTNPTLATLHGGNAISKFGIIRAIVLDSASLPCHAIICSGVVFEHFTISTKSENQDDTAAIYIEKSSLDLSLSSLLGNDTDLTRASSQDAPCSAIGLEWNQTVFDRVPRCRRDADVGQGSQDHAFPLWDYLVEALNSRIDLGGHRARRRRS